ncbi:GIDE domain-containing protein [Actinopolymorpha pittospori]
MIVVGVIALAAALGCAYFAWRARGRQHIMVTTETYAARDLHALALAAAQAVGPGAFRQRCEVAGPVAADVSGPLRSEIGDAECVWHRHVVTRKYWHTDHDSNGRPERVEREEQVAERSSGAGFLVTDPSGAVLVHPGKTRPDGALKVVDRFEPGNAPNGDPDTIGYHYEEWALAPGEQVYVLGEASDATGELAIVEPSIISTRSEVDLLRRTRLHEKAFSVATAAGVVLGPVLILVGALR